MIGIRCKDGVVLAVDKSITNKMVVRKANRRIFTVDEHAGMVSLLKSPLFWAPNGGVVGGEGKGRRERKGRKKKLKEIQVSAGLVADGRHLANQARSEAVNYKGFYGTPIPGSILNDRLA